MDIAPWISHRFRALGAASTVARRSGYRFVVDAAFCAWPFSDSRRAMATLESTKSGAIGQFLIACRRSAPFDAKYALTLGGDAVPALLDAMPQLGAEDRCVIGHGLLAHWDNANSDWRTWNWSRARARSLVRNRADALKASCPTKPKEQHNDH